MFKGATLPQTSRFSVGCPYSYEDTTPQKRARQMCCRGRNMSCLVHCLCKFYAGSDDGNDVKCWLYDGWTLSSRVLHNRTTKAVNKIKLI